MNENQLPYSEREPRFSALIPFFVFVLFYVGLSICAKDFYSIPMPIAFLVASATALLLDPQRKMMDKVEVFAHGMGDNNIMIMCLIFILAGAFAAAANAMGAVDSAVLISRYLIPDKLILVGFFLVACFISLAIGTSCGTIAALAPIAAGIVTDMGLSPALTFGAVIGGAMFGDNMSMISDTTIAATRTQGVAMRDKFLMNLKMIIPAAVVVIAVYLIIGFTGDAGIAENANADLPALHWKHFVQVIPYLFILGGALCGLNVMALLFLGTIMAMVIGIGIDCSVLVSFSGFYLPDVLLTIGNSFLKLLKVAGTGTLNMSETLIVALLAGGLLGVIRHNGGISYLLKKIENNVHGKFGCEFGIILLVSAVNLFTANNTVAIVVAGPIARQLSKKYCCDPRRVASLLDTASCMVQGLIPYGAQILIAIGIAKGAGIMLPSSVLIPSLFYPAMLGVALILSVIFIRIFRPGRRSC